MDQSVPHRDNYIATNLAASSAVLEYSGYTAHSLVGS